MSLKRQKNMPSHRGPHLQVLLLPLSPSSPAGRVSVAVVGGGGRWRAARGPAAGRVRVRGFGLGFGGGR
jgi:hypothetical protein